MEKIGMAMGMSKILAKEVDYETKNRYQLI